MQDRQKQDGMNTASTNLLAASPKSIYVAHIQQLISPYRNTRRLNYNESKILRAREHLHPIENHHRPIRTKDAKGTHQNTSSITDNPDIPRTSPPSSLITMQRSAAVRPPVNSTAVTYIMPQLQGIGSATLANSTDEKKECLLGQAETGCDSAAQSVKINKPLLVLDLPQSTDNDIKVTHKNTPSTADNPDIQRTTPPSSVKTVKRSAAVRSPVNSTVVIHMMPQLQQTSSPTVVNSTDEKKECVLAHAETRSDSVAQPVINNRPLLVLDLPQNTETEKNKYHVLRAKKNKITDNPTTTSPTKSDAASMTESTQNINANKSKKESSSCFSSLLNLFFCHRPEEKFTKKQVCPTKKPSHC